MGAKDASSKSTVELFELCRKGYAEKVATWLQQHLKRPSKSPLKFLRGVNGVSAGEPAAEWLTCLREPSTSYTPLHQAALAGHADVVALLLAGDASLVRAIDRRGCRAIHLAAWAGHAAVVERLLAADPSAVHSVNNAKELALHLAALHGHAQVAQLLLQKGADARLRNARFETPLDIAARTGKADICRVIIARCPELTLQSAADCASTSPVTRPLARQVVYPLHLAARYGNAECVRVLCESGFDVNYLTDEGAALHVAAAFGQVACVALLLEYGADPHIRDADGRTASERLRDVAAQRQPLTTHAAQSAHGWRECRQLIQDALDSPKLRDGYRQLPPDEVFANTTSSTSTSTNTLTPQIYPRTRQPQSGASPAPSNNSASGASLNLHPNALLCRYQSVTPAGAYRNAPVPNCNRSPTQIYGPYDNAAPSNCKNNTWAHNCCGNGTAATIGQAIGRRIDSTTLNGKNTMPNIRPTPPARASVLRLFTMKEAEEASSRSLAEVLEEMTHPSVVARDSATTSGFSTLEKVANYDDDFDTSAPIALPEELDGSTYATTSAATSGIAPFPTPTRRRQTSLRSADRATASPAPSSTSVNSPILNGSTSTRHSPEEYHREPILDARINLADNGESRSLIRRNHSAEWRKIDEILTNIQRESFFGDNAATASNGELADFPHRPNVDAESLELWLRLNVGVCAPTARQLAATLAAHGFNSVQLLKGSLTRKFLAEMGVESSVQEHVLAYLGARMTEMIPSVEKFEYLSDWLDSLELIDHLGAFASANLTHTPEIIAARLTRSDLEKMGIHSLGHIARIVRSLELVSGIVSETIKNGTNEAKVTRRASSDSKTDFLRFLGSVQPPPVEMLCQTDAQISLAHRNRHDALQLAQLYDVREVDALASDTTQRQRLLLDECVSFSAHYLGSTEISNVEGAADCRRAMSASKKRIKQVNKLPSVILEISVGGVSVIDASTNQLTVQHEVSRIEVVCQDELDLNCFAYIFQDGEKHFCHVYCVLTADVAKEIIVTLGETFNLAYAMLVQSAGARRISA